MSTMQFGLGMVAVLLAALLIARLAGARRRAESPFVAKQMLLSLDERSFLDVLERAVGDDYRVFAKVRLADVIDVRDMRDQRARERMFEHITDRRADFVLCTPGNLVVVAIIGFGEKSEDGKRRALRHICRDCNLPLVSFSPRHDYGPDAVRRRVLDALGAPNAPELGPVDAPAGDDDAGTPHLPPVSETEDVGAECPVCGAPMVADDARTPGQWHCPNYPACPGERVG